MCEVTLPVGHRIVLCKDPSCDQTSRIPASKTSVMAGCGLALPRTMPTIPELTRLQVPAFEPNFGVEGSGSDAVEVAVVMERILLTAPGRRAKECR